MSKRKSKVKFALITLATIIGLVLTCFSFRIPYTTYTFNGFARAITLGRDVSSGVLAVYEVSVDNANEFTTKYQHTLDNFKKILNEKGITDVSLVSQGTNRIRIEANNNSAVDMRETFDTLAKNSEFKITKNGEEEAILDGTHLKSAVASMQQSEWGVALIFNDEGTQKFSDLTNEVSSSGTTTGKIDIWLDGEVVLSPQVSAAITYGSTFISGMGSEATAEEYSNRFLSSTFQANLELISNQVVVNPNSPLVRIMIALAVALVVAFALMIVRYGVLGLLADFAVVIFTVLFAFFLQAVPLVELTISGFAGIAVVYAMLFSSHVIIFERIKEEYSYGKKIPASVTSGFKKSIFTVLDISVVAVVLSTLLLFIGAAEIANFASVLLIGAILTLFTSVIVTKGLVNYYLPLNSTKAKKFKLTREDNIDEI